MNSNGSRSTGKWAKDWQVEFTMNKYEVLHYIGGRATKDVKPMLNNIKRIHVALC